MAEYVQVWKAKVADGDVDKLLAVRPEAIAEAKRLCPRSGGPSWCGRGTVRGSTC